MASFAPTGLVVATPANPRPRWLGRRTLVDRLLQGRDRVHPWGLSVDRYHTHAQAGEVAVRVDEARQRRAPTQRHLARTRAGEGANIGGAADGEDTPATDDDRFDDVVPCIDIMDLAAGEAELRRVFAVCEIMRLHGLICYRWGYGQGARQLSQLLDMSS